MSDPVLRVEGLVTSFPDGQGGRLAVVDGISFSVHEGQVLALVGESGCGKSMTAFSILRRVPKPGRIGPGHISVCGKDVLSLPVAEMRSVRGSDAAMIFQEPMTSLNPVQTVGAQVVEAIRLHERISVAEARRRTAGLFERVGIPDPGDRLDAYPHELSGGLKQRVMIAMALSAGLGDALAASALAAVIGAGRQADIAGDLASVGELPVIDFPGENGGASVSTTGWPSRRAGWFFRPAAPRGPCAPPRAPRSVP